MQGERFMTDDSHPAPKLPILVRRTVLREIGRGGMDGIHLAGAPRFQRKPAVQVLRREAPDAACAKIEDHCFSSPFQEGQSRYL
jgi:hypothetical protein